MVIAASLPVRAAVGSEPLVLLQAAVRAVAVEPCDGLDLATVEAGLEGIRREIDLLESEFVRRVGYAMRLREFAPERPGSMVDYLRNRCRLSGAAAAERVEVAQSLSELPRTEEALAQGVIGYEHARVIARTAVDVGPDAARAAEDELLLTAQSVDPGKLRSVAQEVRHRVDPGGALEVARRLYERRGVRLNKGLEGGFWLEGMLDPTGGATLTTALDALMTPTPGDTRSAAQRRADALVELGRRQLQGGELPMIAGQRPHLTLIVPAETLAGGSGPRVGRFGSGCGSGLKGSRSGAASADSGADGAGSGAAGAGAGADGAASEAVGAASGVVHPPGPAPAMLEWAGAVPAETARRIACDAAVTEVTVDSKGNVLDVGRTRRTIPAAIRRALVVRDRGCSFPGCDRPVAWTQSHHAHHWIDGGETRLDNLTLLCTRCHTYVHELGWTLSRGEDGELRAEPP